jgi:hypothetical protein
VDVARKKHERPTFTDCAARYVEQSRGKRSLDVIKWHVRLLQSYIGDLEPRQVDDQTLKPFMWRRSNGRSGLRSYARRSRRPLRRDCGHFVAAHELELSAGSGQARAWQNIGSGRLSAHQSSLCAGHGTTLALREIDI